MEPSTGGRSPLRVALSYVRTSSEGDARRLKSALLERGLEVLVPEEIPLGADLRSYLSDIFAQADVIVVLLKSGDEKSKSIGFETRAILEAGWDRPDLRVFVIAPAVEAIPPALRHQKFVSYIPHGEAAVDGWPRVEILDEVVSRIVGADPQDLETSEMTDKEIRAWRDRLVHVASPPMFSDEESRRIRVQLESDLNSLRERLLADERFESSDGNRILDRLILAQLLDDNALASEYYEVAQGVFARTFPPGPGESADAEYLLGLAALNAGKPTTAAQLFADAVDHDREQLGDRHPVTISALYNLALAQAESRKVEAAAHTYREALDLSLEALGDRHPQTAAIAYNLGILEATSGHIETARQLFTLAVEAYRHVRPTESPELAAALDHLGRLGPAS